MRCFNHPTNESIGTCKACHKGLCAECAEDLGHGLACKGRHEPDVELLNSIVARSARVYSVTPRSRYIAPLFGGFMGLVFLGYGFVGGGRTFGFLSLMGAGFLVYAVVLFLFNRRAFGESQ